MLAIGDIHIYVSDLERAVQFWSGGLCIRVSAREFTPNSGFAVLEFPDGSASLRLLGPVKEWSEGEAPEAGTRPTISFDITTTDFDEVLARLLELGGAQDNAVETYDGLRIVTLADPDGNRFDLIELPPEPS